MENLHTVDISSTTYLPQRSLWTPPSRVWRFYDIYASSALDRSLKKSIQTSKSCLLIGQRAALQICDYFLKNDLKQKETAHLTKPAL